MYYSYKEKNLREVETCKLIIENLTGAKLNKQLYSRYQSMPPTHISLASQQSLVKARSKSGQHRTISTHSYIDWIAQQLEDIPDEYTSKVTEHINNLLKYNYVSKDLPVIKVNRKTAFMTFSEDVFYRGGNLDSWQKIDIIGTNGYLARFNLLRLFNNIVLKRVGRDNKHKAYPQNIAFNALQDAERANQVSPLIKTTVKNNLDRPSYKQLYERALLDSLSILLSQIKLTDRCRLTTN